MLDDDPTTTPASTDEAPAPKKAVRRRATSKVAAPKAAAAEPGAADAGAADAGAADAGAAASAPAQVPAVAAPPAAALPAAAPAEEPAKPVKRIRRATKKAAAPVIADAAPAADAAGAAPAPAGAAEPAAAAPQAPAGDAPAGDAPAGDAPAGDAPAGDAPRKRAPRKRAARKAAAPAAAPDVASEDVAGEDVAVAEALAEPSEPVVEAVEDDEAVAEQAADDVAVPVLAEEEPDKPVARTRRRRAPAVVTFQAPDEVPPPSRRRAAPAPAAPAPAAAPDVTATAEETSEASDAPAPRRRRRAGTAGAVAPADLLPTLMAPEPVEPSLEDVAEASADDDEDDDRPRRRRRGRRGRGRPAEGDTTGESEDDEPLAEGEAPAATEDDEDEDDDETTASGTRRRRRRRRRTGAGGAEEAVEEDIATVVHVREPRQARVKGAQAADEDGVRGITGSTRMAAKRARRQEGRDSGRKRAPILSEAEFLSRRESVERHMIVRQKGEMTQIAVLEDGILVEHYVTKASAQSYAGNVYLGRVQNVLPSMEAAFIDIGKGRNGVLYAGEVNYDLLGAGGGRKIEQVLKSGQEVLVQVSKDPIGHKGARLTSQISLPGRYLVYVPEGSMTGISRKLPETERARLKSILKKVIPDDAGVIIRTAAEGASEEEIAADVRRLQAQWEVIQTKAAKGGAPVQLQAEPDLVVRVVRDIFNEDFSSLVVQGDSEWSTIKDYVEFVAPDLATRLRRHTAETDVFAEHRVDEQLLKALDRKVYLPSGGSLVIDRTEAMVVIDVNTGKYVGKGGNLEETVTRNNLEAAEEIARQLRLRDLGGIIVVDFIDMVLESNRDLVVRRLVECLGRDRTKHQVAEVTSLGLVQMTRKRVGQGLLESFSETCDACGGRGVHVRTDPVDARSGGAGPETAARLERIAAAAVKAKPAEAAGDVASSEEEATDRPKRRRRGGRGSGAATVAPQDEMAELMSEPAGSEIPPDLLDTPTGPPAVTGGLDLEVDPLLDAVADAAATVAADPVAGSTPAVSPELEEELTAAERSVSPTRGGAHPAGSGDAQDLPAAGAQPVVEPDVLPELSDQPPADLEDLPVLPPEIASVLDPEPAPAPKRRRRATSRPAGPPTV